MIRQVSTRSTAVGLSGTGNFSPTYPVTFVAFASRVAASQKSCASTRTAVRSPTTAIDVSSLVMAGNISPIPHAGTHPDEDFSESSGRGAQKLRVPWNQVARFSAGNAVDLSPPARV